jgi:MFS family permease
VFYGQGVTTTPVDRQHLARSIRLVPVHEGLAGSYVWLPVAVLFTRAQFDLHGALLLGSIYYLSVVALEVPSGWVSDRFGRVLTLRVAAGSWVVANLFFLLGGHIFVVFALGNVLLAAGFASLSGTDVSYHYDVLEAAGRAEQYADRQARVRSIGLVATAVSAVVGGLIGLVELRLVYVAALVLALAQLSVTMLLREPPRKAADVPPRSLLSGVGGSLSYLRNRFVGWIFLYGVAMVTLEHVAVTVLQPWLTEVLGRPASDVGSTPLIAGLVYAGFALVGAGAARVSAPLASRFGTIAVLLGLAALSAIIVTGMALWFHLGVLVLVAFRSAQGAAAPVLISAAVSPLVERGHRATLLSLKSLAGRLGFGTLLWAVAGIAADDVGLVLVIFSGLAWLLVAVLAGSAILTTGTEPSTAAGGSVLPSTGPNQTRRVWR